MTLDRETLQAVRDWLAPIFKQAWDTHQTGPNPAVAAKINAELAALASPASSPRVETPNRAWLSRQVAAEDGQPVSVGLPENLVSSAECSAAEIAQARACGRLLVTADGYGFVHLPPASPSPEPAQDGARETENAPWCGWCGGTCQCEDTEGDWGKRKP